MRVPRLLLTFGLVIATSASQAVARPTRGLGPGTRALVLELDRARGLVQLGAESDALVTATIGATIAAGRLVVAPEFTPLVQTPTRWRLDLAYTNRLGVQVERALPVLGVGLPPIAVASDVVPREPGEHVRVQLTVELGRFDGASSAPIFVPPLPVPLPDRAELATLSIDGRDAHLPVGRGRVTFDLDVPATVTLRVEDARGERWIRRAISAADVRRPTRDVPRPASLDVSRRALRLATAVLPLPADVPQVRATGSVAGGLAWVEATGLRDAEAWRVEFGGPTARVVRFGAGPLPRRVEALGEGLTWVEVTQSVRGRVYAASGRASLLAGGPPPSSALRWELGAGAQSGRIARVGTSTGPRFAFALPEDL